jgi:uncharacterized membrane protein YesL
MDWLRNYWLREGPGIPKDAPTRKGLALFGEIVGREWWELVKLNLLFIVFALPLVTLPAAAFATTRVTLAMVEDRNTYLLRDFLDSFRARFWSATLVGGVLVTAVAGAAWVVSIYARAATVNLAFAAPLAMAAAVLTLLPLYGAHLFVLMAMSPHPLVRLLRPAALGLIARPLPAFGALGFVAALWLAHVAFYPVSVFMPALVNFSFGTLALTFGVHNAAALCLASADAAQGSVPPITGAAQGAPINKEEDMSGKLLRRSALLATAVLAFAQMDGRGAAMAQSAEPVTLNWALWDWDAVAYFKPLIEAYEAQNPNVTIAHVDLGSTDYQTMVQTQLTGGADHLDIVTIKDIPSYANLVRANLLLDPRPTTG